MLGAFRGLATRIAMPGRRLLLILALLCLPSGCSRPQPPNVVLIVIDTLRADRLGVAGSGSNLTSFHAVLAADELTLAEVLQQHGYVTGGFIANFLLSKELGFGQGFDRYQT